ncbi:MAG: glycogen-binding domain-containing protein [Gemmatimonadales bacterium]|jgi:hypothetical protein
MRKELQAYLDGELSRDQLPAELRAEADRWDRLLADVRTTVTTEAPVDLRQSVRAALAARQPRSTGRRAFDWAVRPRTVRISPLAGLAAAAALALFVVWGRGVPPASPGPEASTVYIQFALEAPGARSVAVAGDFNQWAPAVELSDLDGDGVWTGRVAVEPGVYQYMFVIDGSEWRTDPNAERYADDGFGDRNAVVVVAPPVTSS